MPDKKKFSVDTLFGLLISAAVFVMDYQRSDFGIAHCLCDGFFVAAVLLLGFGGLKFARNGGAFDIIAYGIGSALRITFPWMGEGKDHDYAGYKERKQATRTGCADLLIVGSVFLVLSVICLIVYLNT